MLREFADVKAGVAHLVGGLSVVFVFRMDEPDRRRALDLLAGWEFGSGGTLDRVGPNTVAARPPGATAVRLHRAGVVPVLEELFGGGEQRPLGREEEDALRPLAAQGSADARRRLTDAYSEVATTLSLLLRPAHLPVAAAVAIAGQELDAIVAWQSSRRPLLVELIERLHARLSA